MKSRDVFSLAPIDRPREKLRYFGPDRLDDAELLAVLIGNGCSTLPVMGLCEEILDTLDWDLEKLASLSVEELCQFKGIGEAKALIIMAALDISERRKAPRKEMLIMDAKAMVTLARPVFEGLNEQKWLLIVMTDNKRLLASCELKSIGRDIPDIARIMEMVRDAGAARFALLRNDWPEDGLSEAEQTFFRELQTAACILELEFDEMIVVGKTDHLSLHVPFKK